MEWDTSRFDAEPRMDTAAFNNTPGQRPIEADRPDRRVRHGYRRFRDCLEHLGWASMAFVGTVGILYLWSAL